MNNEFFFTCPDLRMISVKERLPKKDDEYVIRAQVGTEIQEGYGYFSCSDGWWHEYGNRVTVTHWGNNK